MALLSKNGEENEVLFLESGGLPCSVDESLPMPIRGLRAESYQTGRAVVDNDFATSKWMKLMPAGHVRLKNVMFAPLNISGQTVGLLGLANKPTDFNANDIRLAETFGQLAAIALDNIRKNDALRKEHELSETILGTSRAIILLLDNRGKIVQFNRYTEELTGYTLDEVRGKDWFDTFIPESNKRLIQERFDKDIDVENENGATNPILTKDGKEITIEWYSHKLGEGDEIVGLLSVGVDITERLDLQKRLRQAEKMEAIGHLAGGIAHDFNNILGAIMGYADISLDEVEKGSKLNKYLNNILSSTNRAKDLVNQILSFSRQNPDIKTPQFIRPVVKEVIQLLRAILPATIQIESQLSEDTLPIFANATKIHEVVMNLCTNAAHAMGEKGLLEIIYQEQEVVTTRAGKIGQISPGLYSVITVKDNGKGIPQEVLERMFEPFYTTKDVGEGTGMGLAVVFGIVQSHGGDILVDSQETKGSEFQVFLPKSKEVFIEPSDDDFVEQGGREKLLFVDDEVLLCDMMSEMLGNLGYRVDTVNSGAAALSRIKAEPDEYDVVVTDQTMPQMTGLELAQEILQIRKELPIVLCTGYSKGIDENVALSTGIKGFCMKPLRKADISAKLRAILDNQ